MSKATAESIWVAVRVERGFVSEVEAYESEEPARRKEMSWKRQNNPDYDETLVSKVRVKRPRFFRVNQK